MDYSQCPEENTVYLYVRPGDVQGFCRVGDIVLQGTLRVDPDWFSTKDITKVIAAQTKNGQLSLNQLNGFDFASNYTSSDLKLDYPVIITEVVE